MRITSKSKAKCCNENWGMGLLLVFFPDDNSSSSTIVDKANPLSSPSHTSSSSPSITTNKAIKRTNSNNPILTKAQSTISICVLLLFFTLLRFTLSTFEPTTAITAPRRFLTNKPPQTHHTVSWFSRIWNGKCQQSRNSTKKSEFLSSFAFQGMGKLYCRGTRAMTDLLVGHVVEDTSEDEFKLFLRLLHRSGLTARADVVFIFGSSSSASRFESLIREENDSFLKLVHHYKELNSTSRDSVSVGPRFDVTQFLKRGKEMGEPLWGKRIRASNYNESERSEGELIRLSYGSVVGFEANELDPEKSLAGFLDHVPMSLNRWACYPMLLGRIRRNFKHIMLVDVKKLVLLSDPLSRVRNQSPETVYITINQEGSSTSSSSKHGKKNNSGKTPYHSQVNSAFLIGGTRGIRRFSNAMLNEIVRVAMQHNKKNSVTESGILSQMVKNRHILKNIDLMISTESIPEESTLSGSISDSAGWDQYKIIQRGKGNQSLNSIIMKQICSCEVGSSVYRDC